MDNTWKINDLKRSQSTEHSERSRWLGAVTTSWVTAGTVWLQLATLNADAGVQSDVDGISHTTGLFPRWHCLFMLVQKESTLLKSWNCVSLRESHMTVNSLTWPHRRDRRGWWPGAEPLGTRLDNHCPREGRRAEASQFCSKTNVLYKHTPRFGVCFTFANCFWQYLLIFHTSAIVPQNDLLIFYCFIILDSTWINHFFTYCLPIQFSEAHYSMKGSYPFYCQAL